MNMFLYNFADECRVRVALVAGDQWHKISVKLAKEQINCDGICIGYGFPEIRMGFSGDSAGRLAFVWTCSAGRAARV